MADAVGSRLLRLATLEVSSEADVEQYWVPELLASLGYRYPRDIRNAPKLTLDAIYLGREKAKVFTPDHVVSAFGRVAFVLEVKKATTSLSANDAGQARSYAIHPEVQAPLTVVTNARTTMVYQTQDQQLLLRMEQAAFADAERFAALRQLLGRSTLGRRAGSLVLQEELGRGAFGVVYRAWNPLLRRSEAVKVYRRRVESVRSRDRFVRGLRLQGGLRHPGIAEIYGVFPYGSATAVSMYFSPGARLDRWLQTPRSLDQKWLVFGQIVDAIAFAHDRGVVHRDIKPNNVLIEERDAGWQAVVVDFDTAAAVDSTVLTRASEAVGTLGFLAPEMASEGGGEKRDKRADVYSLGAVLFFMLTGRAPEPHQPMRLQERALVEADLGAEDQGRALLLIARSLDPRAAGRYRDAGEFAAELRTALRPRHAANELEQANSVLTALVAAVPGYLPGWPTPDSDEDMGQVLRFWELPDFGELAVIFDADYGTFFVGLSFDEDQWPGFAAGPLPARLHEELGAELRLDEPTRLEDGGALVVVDGLEMWTSAADELAGKLLAILARFVKAILPHVPLPSGTATAEPTAAPG
jgi:tRNA A-37 threonylcarbamoyl transferase component Bud32